MPPRMTSDPTLQASLVDEFLEKNTKVQVVIVQWVDIVGVLRSRLLPVATFKSLVASGRHLNNSPLDLAMTSTEDIVPEVFEHFVDRGRVIPDVSSLKVAAADSSGIGNASVCFGTVDYRGLDARANLRRLIDKATEQGLTFLVGIELEFAFLMADSLDPAGPSKPGVGMSSYTHRSILWPILNEIAVTLSSVGINIEQIIKEYGPSSWEVALPPLPPLEAVDAYVNAKELIKNIAYRRGVVATFYPTPFGPDGFAQKIGQHIHISATSDSATWDPNTVLSGILSHTPALTAVGLPQYDSYERVGAMKMCTGGYVGWGDNNRDMPVRRISANHWEFRVHDGTANTYATVAGLIAGALDPKPLKITNADKWTAKYSDSDREEMGLTMLLPSSLEQALDAFEKDREWAEETWGKDYVKWFLILKRHELPQIAEMDAIVRRLHFITYF